MNSATSFVETLRKQSVAIHIAVEESVANDISASLRQAADMIEALCKVPMSPDEFLALGYGTRLATSLWEKHYKADAPEWRPIPTLIGVLTQIDNMTTGLVRREDKK